MKKKFFPWLSIALLTLAATAFTMDMPARKPMPLSISVIKDLTDPLGYKNLPVSIDILIKDADGIALYLEKHEITLNELAEAKINVGEGTNQVPPFETTDLSKASKLCYTVIVHTPEGDVELTGEEPIGQQAFAMQSETAENANALGNVKWGSEHLTPMDLFGPPADRSYYVPVVRKPSLITDPSFYTQLQVRDYVKADTKPSAFNAEPVDYLCIGTGNPCPWLFGYKDIVEIENYYTVYPGPMQRFWNAMAVKVPPQAQAIGHSSAALYLEHNLDQQGVGLYANGFSRGIYTIGNTGIISLFRTLPGLNVVSVWGYAGGSPATGDTGYAGLFQDNDQANVTALGVFGGGFTTKPFTIPSDRRLKTEIRSAVYGLNAVMQLRPILFNYMSGTPYSFPEGDQHGFVAQEVEEVIPELVSELTFPKSLDPDLMATSGTETYKSINLTGLIPVLTKALQELNDKVDAQAAEIEKLKAELTAAKPK